MTDGPGRPGMAGGADPTEAARAAGQADAAAGPRLMLVDSASLFFRAFFGVPDRRPTPDAPANNAVRGFLDMLATLAVSHRPSHLVACWDEDWRPAFRVAAIPSYKAHRLAAGSQTEEEVPEALVAQIPVIALALAAVGIPRVGCAGYEADDVIGTLSTAATERAAARVDIVTGDRDLFQLVDDRAGIRVLYTARGGVRDADVVTGSYLSTRYGVAGGSAYADVAVLRGDPSDGLPGVAGVGEKTATSLIAMYGDLAGLRAAVEASDPRLPPARLLRLREAASYLDAAALVVRVVRDCPVPGLDAIRPGVLPWALPPSPADPQLLQDLVDRYDLSAPVGRLGKALWPADRGDPR